MYRAKVIKDSVSPYGIRLITVEWEFPRIVLAEVVTHRVMSDTTLSYEERTTTKDMSKNSASSRAIPIARMLRKVESDPYIPERFSKNGAGMQGHGWLEGEEHERARAAWVEARNSAITSTKKLMDLGVHKQDANRLLEPFSWVTQIVTADTFGWANFFALRCHKDTHPAFRQVARMAYTAINGSTPQKLSPIEWHLPFVDEAVLFNLRKYDYRPPEEEIPDLIKFSAVRCAWASYENHNAERSEEAMLATWSRLMGGTPKHASPTEHQGFPEDTSMFMTRPSLRSNLTGYVQLRKLITGERAIYYKPSEEELKSWDSPTEN